MDATVASAPDLSLEIPADSAKTPQWFDDAMATPRREGWLDSAGCPIHYFSWGNPANPGILLLHGFLAHSRCFAFIAPLLANDYHVVAYDFSGMGDSGARETYPDQVRLQELMDVASETGLFNHEEKPSIIAHSYGGSIGLVAMEECHEHFSQLVICDLMTLRPERLKAHTQETGPPGSQDPQRPNRIYPDYATAKGRFVLSPPQKVNEAYLFDYMAYHSLQQVDGGWSWKFHPSVFEHNSAHLHERLLTQATRIASAPGRVVIVYGEQSKLFDADSADYIRESGGGHIPMIGIPDARHHLMLDQPVAFASTLKTILAMHEALCSP